MDLKYRDEREIIALAASQDDSEVCFYPAPSDLGYRLLSSLRGQSIILHERPDFFDDEQRLLLEVMIVDDHPRRNKKDATRAREAEMLREVKETGLVEQFPNASLVAIANTGLPTDDDHNFRAYLRHFTKVVSDHARNVDAYRSVRPEFDLAFVLLDESTAYFETANAFAVHGQNRPHAWFADHDFLQVLKLSGADCVAWVTPYKHLEAKEGPVPLPRLTIIDLGEVDNGQSSHFNAERMVSAER